ncbi:MAG TPA: hypothetical protein VFJ16_15565 [Longimicrobium sp.]|nr:hypothetical protein [Longimicrobium sp.]
MLAACVAFTSTSLAAQEAPPRPGLLPVLTGGDGTQVLVDASSVSRSGDSTFVASTVLRFAPLVAEQKQVGVEVGTDEIDCGREQVRTMMWAMYRQQALVLEGDSLPGHFNPVAADWLPIVRATRGVLLGTYGSAQVEYELRTVDVVPELRNATRWATRCRATSPPTCATCTSR